MILRNWGLFMRYLFLFLFLCPCFLSAKGEYNFPQRLRNVKAILLDVDGTLTDGSVSYTATGEEIRTVMVKDLKGLKRLKAAGYIVAALSPSESPALIHMLDGIGLDAIYIKVTDRMKVLNLLCSQQHISPSQVLYMTDEAQDIGLFKVVGIMATCRDCSPVLVRMCPFVTRQTRGNGAIAELADRLIAFKKGK
jgi:3-deoxy-D-manno-octulosonate 8-phosphate phosphatase (KDO 8-P phosphatase)